MTPKEKAEQLIRHYYEFSINKEGQSLTWYECKQCALIAVGLEFDYWEQVKTEIENL